MALIDELHSGSFRGASFLIKSATTVGGRKQVKHEYPNSPLQNIEDLGFQPRNFKIRAIIAADPPNAPGGRTYLDKRNSLLEALERAGPGTLSHPYYSNSIEVVARNYTIIEDTTRLDVAEIDLEFDLSNRFTDPQPITPSLSQINAQRNVVFSNIEESISDDWEVSTADNFDAANEKLNEFVDFTRNVTNTFNQDINELNSFSATLNGFSSTITQLIQNPSNLASSFIGVIDSSAGLYQTVDASLQVFARFFGFGDGDVQPDPTTPQRAQRNSNDDLINNYTQASYLALTYEAAAQKEYTVVDEINDVQERMEDQYQKLVDQNLDTDVIDSLNDLRTLTNQWLETQRLNASQIITVNTKMTSAYLLAYQYYGPADDLYDLADTLVDLNRPESNDVTFIDGEVEIVTV